MTAFGICMGAWIVGLLVREGLVEIAKAIKEKTK